MRRGVVLEVAQGLVQVVFLAANEGVRAGGGADAVDVAVVQVGHAGGGPVLFLVAEHELQDAMHAPVANSEPYFPVDPVFRVLRMPGVTRSCASAWSLNVSTPLRVSPSRLRAARPA
jgi:hypothetical protein